MIGIDLCKPPQEIKEKIEEINNRTRNGGAEIVKYLKTGSAYYAPSSSTVAMVEAVLLNTDRILPVCAYLNGEYGVKGLYCGVPVRLGSGGVSKIIELSLNDVDLKSLQASVSAVKELAGKLG